MFDLGDTNLLLPLLRGAFVAALFSAFGASLFIWFVAPQGLKLIGAPEAGAIEGRCLRLVRASLATALFALIGWLALEASDMSDAANAADAFAVVPAVVLGTSFGHDLFAQALSVFAALVLLAVWPQRLRFAAVGLAGLALVIEAGHSHAFAMEHGPSLLLYAEGLHVVAGGALLGGLLSLLILVRDAPPKLAAETLRRFSKLATFCVIAIAGIACFQGWVLGGGVGRSLPRCSGLPSSTAFASPRRWNAKTPEGEMGALAHHRGRDRPRAHGGACRRRAEWP
jgi:copper resistance protein D